MDAEENSNDGCQGKILTLDIKSVGCGGSLSSWGAKALFLLADYIYHESNTFIMWRMKRHIRNGETVPPRLGGFSLKKAKLRREIPFLIEIPLFPLILTGPSRCGMTTALREYANDLKDENNRAVLISLREYVVGDGKSETSSSINDVCKRLMQLY